MAYFSDLGACQPTTTSPSLGVAIWDPVGCQWIVPDAVTSADQAPASTQPVPVTPEFTPLPSGPAQVTPCEQLYDPVTEAVALANCLRKRGAAPSTFPIVPVIAVAAGVIVLWAVLKKGKK